MHSHSQLDSSKKAAEAAFAARLRADEKMTSEPVK